MDLSAVFEIVATRSDNWVSTDNFTNTSVLNIDYLTRHPVLSYSYIAILVFFTLVGNFGNFVVSS